MRIKSIKNKILISVLLIILLFGLLAVFMVFNYSKNILIKKEEAYLSKTSYRFSQEIDQIFNDNLSIAKIIASQDYIINFTERNVVDNNIKDYLNSFNVENNFSAIYLMNKDGLTLASTYESFLGNNYGFRDYFQNAINGNSYVDVAVGLTSNELGYFFSTPIFNNKEVVGVLVLKMKPEGFERNINFSRANHSEQYSNFMITDSYGIVLYSDLEGSMLKSLGELGVDYKNNILKSKKYPGVDIDNIGYNDAQISISKNNKESLINSLNNINGEKYILSIQKISNFPFYIILKAETNVYLREALSVAEILAVFVLLAAIFAALVLTLLVYSFLKPLSSLREYANKISQGDYNLKLDTSKYKTAELKDLSDSFNKMVLGIKKSRVEIEKKVKDQTKKIFENSEYLKKQQKAILNILEDVEAEKNNLSQERNRIKRILESIGDAVFVLNNKGNIDLLNDVALVLLGENKEKNVLRKNYKEVLNIKSENKDFSKDIIGKISEKGIITNNQDFVLINNKGKEISVALTVSSLKSSNNNTIKGCIIVLRDVSKDREVDKAKTEFVSLASHQLRTPLSAVNWYAEMLLNEDAGKINKEQEQYLKEIYNGNNRMVDLVNSLLNVSRLELGTFEIDPKLTDIKLIAKSVLKELEVDIKNKKLKINVKIDKKLPKIKLDQNLTRMIFQNLLSNAVKYTPKNGKINLIIKLDKEKKNVCIDVEDTGMGIPSNQQENIFSKLFRADNAKQSDTEGTGLGLYIVKAILDISGGKVWFESKKNKGTKFHVLIPKTGMKSKKGTKKLS